MGQDFAILEALYTVVRIIQKYPTVVLPQNKPDGPTGDEKRTLTLLALSGDGGRVLGKKIDGKNRREGVDKKKSRSWTHKIVPPTWRPDHVLLYPGSTAYFSLFKNVILLFTSSNLSRLNVPTQNSRRS